MQKPALQIRLQEALGLPDSDFSYHATDLYVVARPGVKEWLREHYEFPRNVERFVGAKGSEWEGLPCFDIPFAGLPLK